MRPRSYTLVEVSRDGIPYEIATYFDLDSALDERDRRRRETDGSRRFYGITDDDSDGEWLEWPEEAVA